MELWASTIRVYPRRRGGAFGRIIAGALGQGLSPQARGSRREFVVVIPGTGSIPAGAGEPKFDRGKAMAKRVYPRRRGGAP